MQELDKALDIAVPDSQCGSILKAYEDQITVWNLTMPAVQPLVLDFGLGDFNDVGLIESWICNEMDAGYCGKYLFLFDGQTCPMHRHRTKVETFFLVRGTVALSLGGEVQTLHEGDTLLVEPWKPHCLTAKGPALILEISTPCEVDDNYFENPDIPIGGNYGGKAL